jgi:hypothetical protein
LALEQDGCELNFRSLNWLKKFVVTDQTKERIKFNTEIIKLLVLLFIGSGGGVIFLLLQGVTMGRQVVIIAGGMIVAMATGIFAFVRYRNTEKLIR